MSNDFNKVLVQDDRIMPTDALDYAVYKGGQNNTYQSFEAISKSTSQLSFNVQCPSESTIVGRSVLLRTRFSVNVVFTDTSSNPTVDDCVYGRNVVLAPFPVHQLMTTLQTTINNNTTAVNIRDVLPAILRFHDKDCLQKWSSGCPSQYDQYGNYDDSYTEADSESRKPLGNSPFNGYSSIDADLNPRGSFAPISYTATASGDNLTLALTFETVEPLLVSPFTFLDKYPSCKGMYGITNLNVVANLGDASRMIRTRFDGALDANQSVSVSGLSIDSCQLLFNFVSSHPSNLMASKNILPYYDLPRYIDTKTVNSWAPSTSFTPSTYQTFTSQNLQLNQIPDYLVVFVRKPLAQQSNGGDSNNSKGVSDPDAFLGIRSVKVNFNNRSGLLSTASVQDLWKMSVENGYNGRWEDWYGKSNRVNGEQVANTKENVSTSGSVLILQFGKDIEIGEDFYAPGSIGNFNLQYTVEVENTGKDTLNSVELVSMVVNSGLYVLERGTSQTFTAILGKEAVLDSSKQEPVSAYQVARLIGGKKSLTQMIKTAIPKLGKRLGRLARKADKQAGEMASRVMGGYGVSGGRRMAQHVM